MNNKELLLEAIDNYDVYRLPGKNILKALVAASKKDNTVHISIKSLSELSKVSRQGVYNTLRYLEADKIIERNKDHKLTVFILNVTELEKIVDYYNTLKAAKTILKKT
jgi:CTP-dependent riboflavin kinase